MCFGSQGAPQTSNNFNFSTQSTSYSPWASGGAENIFNNAYKSVGDNPAQMYGGPAMAAFGPQWGAASHYLMGQLGHINPMTQQAGGALGNLLGAIDPNASVQSLMSPYLDSVMRPTLQNLDRQYGQASQHNAANAAMAGAYGGSAQGVGQAALDRSHEQDVANATGQAYNNAYQTALGQKLQQQGLYNSAANALAGVGQNAYGQLTGLAGMLAGMGSTQQQAGQQGINTQLAINKQNAMLPMEQQSLLASLLGQLAPLGGSTTSGFGFGQQQQMGQPNNSGFSLLGSLLGGLR